MVGSLALKMSHGYTTEKSGHDPLVQLAEEVMSQFSFTGQAGVWMVDILPFCMSIVQSFSYLSFFICLSNAFQLQCGMFQTGCPEQSSNALPQNAGGI